MSTQRTTTMVDNTLNESKKDAPTGGLKPIDIPVPVFPQRTLSVPTFGHTTSVTSNTNNRQFQTFQTKADWRLFLTVEERQLIRQKISSAYDNRTQTYEELLQTCAAIEEELVFASAPSRLDYFKTGMQFEKRVAEKRKHLTEGPLGSSSSSSSSSNGQAEVFSPGKPVLAAIAEIVTEQAPFSKRQRK